MLSGKKMFQLWQAVDNIASYVAGSKLETHTSRSREERVTARLNQVRYNNSEVESRTQGSRPRPRTPKKSEAKAKDSLFEDKPSRGQGQECSRPRPRTKDTAASALQKKKVFKKFFQMISNL